MNVQQKYFISNNFFCFSETAYKSRIMKQALTDLMINTAKYIYHKQKMFVYHYGTYFDFPTAKNLTKYYNHLP